MSTSEYLRVATAATKESTSSALEYLKYLELLPQRHSMLLHLTLAYALCNGGHNFKYSRHSKYSKYFN